MTAKPIGLYVHVPFCKKKCSYCDFCSFPTSAISWREEYVDRLCKEITAYKNQGVCLDTIFFGGGTPSLLSPAEFSKITDSIRRAFNVLPNTEFTLEANPATLTRESLCSYISEGVNRLSIGLQSIHENELKKLGRIHNFDEFRSSYFLSRDCGIDNVNVDLMYGIPHQSRESFQNTLKETLALFPEHISVYGLILEDGTPLFEQKDKLSFPTEDEECDMYEEACKILSGTGYLHYEISNYAKPGRECKHNLKYWKGEEYIGVGVSAYSYFNEERFRNSQSIDEYLSGNGGKFDLEKISKSDKAYEYVMLRLRLEEGFCPDEYERLFGHSFTEGREGKIKSFLSLGYMQKTNGFLSLTEKGFYVSNFIINELI